MFFPIYFLKIIMIIIMQIMMLPGQNVRAAALSMTEKITYLTLKMTAAVATM